MVRGRGFEPLKAYALAGSTPQDLFSGHVNITILSLTPPCLGGPAPLTWLGNPRTTLREEGDYPLIKLEAKPPTLLVRRPPRSSWARSSGWIERQNGAEPPKELRKKL